MKKLFPLATFAAGYVLGARAGRQRYEQIRDAANRIKDDPHVRSAASSVAETARDQAPVVRNKVMAAASAAAGHTPFGSGGASGADQDLVDQLHPDSTARQDDPYPQGDLP